MTHNKIERLKKTTWVSGAYLAAFSLIAASAFSGCAKQNIAADETRKVKGTPVIITDIPDEIGGFGSLSFLAKVDITAPQDGTIKRIACREGDTAKAGQLALLLENPQIKLAVERAENNYDQALAAKELAASRLLEGEFQAEAQLLAIEKAEAELAQAKRKWGEDSRKHQNQEILFEAGGVNTEAILAGRFSVESEKEQILIMEKELAIRKIGCRDQDLIAAGMAVPESETARRRSLVLLMTATIRAELNASAARLEAAEKELFSARIALSELTVRSPASGIVGARYFEEGERVKAGEKLLTLMDTASLYAIFPLREKDALRMEKGMKALVHIDGTGDMREGLVDLVYPQADNQSMSLLVRVLLEGSSDLKPGMFARVSISAGPPKRILAVPEASIFGKKDGEGCVFVINGASVSLRNITLGNLIDSEREVSSGLNEGELVVLRPDTDMREGTRVTLVQ